MRLTALGRAVLAGGVLLTALGVGFGWPACTASGVLCLALLAMALVVVVEAPRLTVGRLASPPEVPRDAPASVRLTLTSTSPRRSRSLTIVERVAGKDRVARLRRLGKTPEIIEYGIDTSRRGVVVSGPLEAYRIDPFGLITASSLYGGTCSVRIRPRVHQLRMLPTGRQRDLEGPTRERSEGTASFHQIREYQPGDDLRRVHWRTTARTGTLMVKQMVDTTRPELVVVLDNRRTAIGDGAFEEAVEIAASLLRAAENEGFPHSLLFADGRSDIHLDQRADSESPIGHHVPFLDRLTEVQRSDDDSLLQLGEQTAARGRSLVMITGEPVAEDMVAIGRIAAGFSPAFLVSVADERHGPLVAPPGMRPLSCRTAVEFLGIWRAA